MKKKKKIWVMEFERSKLTRHPRFPVGMGEDPCKIQEVYTIFYDWRSMYRSSLAAGFDKEEECME